MAKIAILIIEDEPLIANDIREICLENGYAVAGVAYTMQQGLGFLDSEQVDYVLLDIQLGNHDDGLLVGQKLSTEYYIPFSYISSFSDGETVGRARATSPSGYLIKPFRPRDIVVQIELGMDIARRMSKVDLPPIDKVNELAIDNISEREYDIILKIFKGKSNLEISEELFISMNTVKSHLKKIFTKMDVKSRTALLNKLFS